MDMRKNEASWIAASNRWRISVQRDGTRKSFYSSTPGKKGKIECECKADDWLAGESVNDGTRVSILLGAWLEDLKQRTSQSHWRQYESYINNWISPMIGSKRIKDVRKTDLQRIINSAYANGSDGDGLSLKSLKNLRSCVSSFLKYCRADNATTLTAEFITIPRQARASEKTIATPEDLATLFRSDETIHGGRISADRYIHAYRLEALIGLRPGELIGLEWTDLIGDKLLIRRSINRFGEITAGKNENAKRAIILPDLAVSELHQQRDMLRSEAIVSPFIFPREDGSAITQEMLRDNWQRYCRHNGINEATTPYELRHTFVSVVDEMPTLLKKQIVGHSQSMDTDGVYGHAKQNDLRKAADYINDAFAQILKI